MNSATKTCQNCNQSFQIEPEDFVFYEKIQVPPPTFCPECRMVRRLIWRNEKTIYKRKCDFTGNSIFSAYSPDKRYKVYDNSVWYSDQWDPMQYGRDIDFSRPFLAQFLELCQEVPRPAKSVIRVVNSDYCNNATAIKNCYLLFTANGSEDSFYGSGVNSSKDCVDNLYIDQCSFSYENFWINRCNRAFFSVQCDDCTDIYFSKNLRNCNDCFGCVGLRGKSYHIFNEPYSKEEYNEKIKELFDGSHLIIQNAKNKITKFWVKYPNKFMEGTRNESSSGDYIYNSKNTKNSYLIRGGENLRYCQFLHQAPSKDCYDHTSWGNNEVLTYECCVCGEGTNNVKFCAECWGSVNNLEYCYHCKSSAAFLFGCVGLRGKQYCILNKQYTKESFDELRTKIIEHMNSMPYIDNKGRTYKYGEFFPTELSPFAYNETIAQAYFPLTKQEAIDKGYQWKDPEERNIQTTIKAEDLPDHIKDVKDDITKEIIQCQHAGSSPSTSSGQTAETVCNEQCTKAFKIIPQELEFYKKMNLPLPRLCPNCRHYQRLRQSNPPKLWKRQCQCSGTHSSNNIYQNTIEHPHKSEPCPNTFETSYSPERQEIVYCEQCYQQEVA